VLEGIYRAYLRSLLGDLSELRRSRRVLGLETVVAVFESLGCQRERVGHAYTTLKHESPRTTLEYVSQGRHLGFCCDRW
jgi:hypothetical protein